MRRRKVSSRTCFASKFAVLSGRCRSAGVTDADSAAGACAGVLAMMRSLNVAILFYRNAPDLVKFPKLRVASMVILSPGLMLTLTNPGAS
jgi:hypothetical protein